MKKITIVVLLVVIGFIGQSKAEYSGPSGQEIAEDAYAVASLLCDDAIESDTQVITVKKAGSDNTFSYGFYIYLPEGGSIPLEVDNSIMAGIKSGKDTLLLSTDCSSYEQLVSTGESEDETSLWGDSDKALTASEEIPSSPPSYMCTIKDSISGSEKLYIILLYEDASGESCIADLISGKNITLTEAEKDTDGDTVFDEDDNAPEVSNPEQEDTDNDGVGDAADSDNNGAGGGSSGSGGDCSLSPAAGANGLGWLVDILILGMPAALFGFRRK